MIRIRPFEAKHWPAVWRILEPEFRAGETYAFSPDISEAEARQAWTEVPAACGQGIASAMCAHSQTEAVVRGFRAMQYNLVVSTNEGAIRLWKKHGFAVIGVLPEAFRRARLGYVDALVMYKMLPLA